MKKDASIAFIGKFAETPRYQGGGSSHINSFKVESALDMVKGMDHVVYAQGYHTEEDQVDEVLEQEAVAAAAKAEVAVIFAGLPDSFESEGYDRTHMKMPKCQNHLIERIAQVQPNTVVVLHNGSPVEMPWVSQVKGILEAYLGGQAVGGAVCDILFGDVNPSGKLAETFPVKLEDNPSWLTGFGDDRTVEYREGIFVGYRYYEKKNMEVLFPFGHGLSYTTFQYSNLTLDKEEMADTDTLTVTVDITNTGARAGKEAVQLYVADRESTVARPLKELKDFAKVSLEPGETKTLTFTLGKRAFAYWNTRIHNWHVESGLFDIIIGSSSAKPELTASVKVRSTQKLPKSYTLDSTLGDILEDSEAMEVLGSIINSYMDQQISASETGNEASKEAISMDMIKAMIQYMPLRGLLSFAAGKFTREDILEALAKLNG